MRGVSDSKSKVFIGMGSNLGNRMDNLDQAWAAISRSPSVRILDSSGTYDTLPVDNRDQPVFLNCVIWVETDLSPHELLDLLQGIEDSLGRKRIGWKGPRTIDLDILLYDNAIIRDRYLTIPHPELIHRTFLIRQIMEIDPDIIDPLSQRELSSFLVSESSRSGPWQENLS